MITEISKPCKALQPTVNESSNFQAKILFLGQENIKELPWTHGTNIMLTVQQDGHNGWFGKYYQ